MSRPKINKNPGATAATVHNESVIQIWVFGVSSFKIPYSSKVPKPGRRKFSVKKKPGPQKAPPLNPLSMNLHSLSNAPGTQDRGS